MKKRVPALEGISSLMLQELAVWHCLMQISLLVHLVDRGFLRSYSGGKMKSVKIKLVFLDISKDEYL